MTKKDFINQVNSLYFLAWSLTCNISSLLDQMGIPPHRVFSESVMEQFFFFLNNPPKNDGQLILINETISDYIQELFALNSRIISSVDRVVIKSITIENQEKKSSSLLSRILKGSRWSDCASVRFNRVICPVYEEILCKN